MLLILVVLNGCTKPVIPISDTLEIGLGKRYSEYVTLLNKAADKDNKALVQLLTFKNIEDGAGYDHGWVLIELIKKVGDEEFSIALLKLNNEELERVRSYFNAGYDVYKNTDNLPKEYPLTFKVLGYSNTGGVPFR